MQAPVRTKTLDWSNVAGPVAQAYEANVFPISCIIGPTGGGKTYASARRCLRVSLMQHPSPIDGRRKSRIVCLASSYRVLWDTAIASYRAIYPTEGEGAFGKWVGSYGQPATHSYSIRGPDGIWCDIEIQFRSPGDQGDLEEFMRGREVTGWWFPEMDTLAGLGGAVAGHEPGRPLSAGR